MRLIDADILKEAFIVNTDRKGYLVADPKVIIDNAPTVPLPGFKEGYKQAIIDGKTNFSSPQGEWIRPKSWEDGYKGVVCSNCGKKFDIIEWSPNMLFCYNCGADMREELRKHFGRKERKDWNK